MPLARTQDFRRCACLALLFGIAGCAGLNDPFQRAGTWQPANVNDANLQATIADPHHLTQGASDDASPAVLSAAAVRRLLTDRTKPLTTTSIGPIAGGASPGGAGGNGGAGGGL